MEWVAQENVCQDRGICDRLAVLYPRNNRFFLKKVGLGSLGLRGQSWTVLGTLSVRLNPVFDFPLWPSLCLTPQLSAEFISSDYLQRCSLDTHMPPCRPTNPFSCTPKLIRKLLWFPVKGEYPSSHRSSPINLRDWIYQWSYHIKVELWSTTSAVIRPGSETTTFAAIDPK